MPVADSGGRFARALWMFGWVATWALIVLPAIEVTGRQLTRTSLLPVLPFMPLHVAILPLAALLLAVVLRRSGGRKWSVAAIAAVTVIGLTYQLEFGARLQSDGFYYFAYLRSLAFDRDVNFLNDYVMLGLERHTNLFDLTATGHAQSAWTIGPALAWAPFFAAGH